MSRGCVLIECVQFCAVCVVWVQFPCPPSRPSRVRGRWAVVAVMRRRKWFVACLHAVMLDTLFALLLFEIS